MAIPEFGSGGVLPCMGQVLSPWNKGHLGEFSTSLGAPPRNSRMSYSVGEWRQKQPSPPSSVKLGIVKNKYFAKGR